jgi:hypothetical protein
MERRRFIEWGAVALAAGAISLLAGCTKADSVSAPANQERLWNMTAAAAVSEPVDLAYAKNTPAVFKDASFGKEDPNFKPKTGGG